MKAKTHRKLLKYAWRARKHGVPAGRAYLIAYWSHYYGLPLSLGYAVVEHESAFRNVFGHDPTGSIPSSWKGGIVTKARYLYYKARRKAGHGMQGVGPGQLTWYATQDRADAVGGCYKWSPNVRVTLATLKENIRAYGYVHGVERYNGAGPAAVTYSRVVRGLASQWHRKLS
jgi:hypothetical protein